MYKINLSLDINLAQGYTSKSQIARVVTEKWVLDNSYCPCCGEPSLNNFENNRPVADFYCKNCSEEFELKSKKGIISNTIVDGSYLTMMSRINAENNPNFFFLTYSKEWLVRNFLIVPKHFFTPEIIIQRKPLAETAKRSGWIGCNINLSKIPDNGKIFLIKNGVANNPTLVKENFSKTLFLRSKDKSAKSWILDTMACIDSIKNNDFAIDDVYKFEELLKAKHPNNNFIKEKIRQQLQVLRDNGIIDFLGKGRYRKTNGHL